MKLKLSEAQVNDIVETLHYNIRFYAPSIGGAATVANESISKRITEVLLQYYGPKKYRKVRL